MGEYVLSIVFVVVGVVLLVRPSTEDNPFPLGSWGRFLFPSARYPGRHRDRYARAAGLLLVVFGLGSAAALRFVE